ncbi:MAG: hypothetical protein JRN58_02405 [Nitrososphaerota archaeon]|nr:hypothetical protein [Nitrososphaerota archaeon]MDG6977914.1 hypothetical protein [Nitrososphaerota archaeon]MDG7022324.1 hypothetical protein [Nitrososphaerota archaeon]
MDEPSKGLTLAALSGLALTVLSAFVVDGESVSMFTWGYPVAYFERLYPDAIDFNGTAHTGNYVLWSQAAFDFALWFLLSAAVMACLGLAWKRLKPVTRGGTPSVVARR